MPKNQIAKAPYFLYGGHAEAERSIVIFDPDYLDENGIRPQEREQPNLIEGKTAVIYCLFDLTDEITLSLHSGATP